MARLTEYDFELCKEICDQLADGENIVRVLRNGKDYPTWSTFRRWKNENEELRTLYVNSQQDKATALENEIDDIMLSLKDGQLDASTANVLIQTLKWKMAKFYPKVFGDQSKLTLEGGEKPITISFED
jgi:hypothetical protein